MLIIDRFEGDFAVCEDEEKFMRQILRSQLPPEAREGDVLMKDDAGWRIDRETTAKRRQENASVFRRLLKK